MSVTLIAVLKIKPEMVSESKSFMNEIIPDTRAFDGCQGIQIYFDTEKVGLS